MRFWTAKRKLILSRAVIITVTLLGILLALAVVCFVLFILSSLIAKEMTGGIDKNLYPVFWRVVGVVGIVATVFLAARWAVNYRDIHHYQDKRRDEAEQIKLDAARDLLRNPVWPRR